MWGIGDMLDLLGLFSLLLVFLLSFVVYVWLCRLFSNRLCKQVVTHSIKYYCGMVCGGLMLSGFVLINLASINPLVLAISDLVTMFNIPFTKLMQLAGYQTKSAGMVLAIAAAMQVMLIIYSIIVFVLSSIFDYKKRTCAMGLLCLAHVLSFIIAYGLQFATFTYLFEFIPEY